MKILSGASGGIKSIQTGESSLNGNVNIPHDPVDVEKSQLIFYAKESDSKVGGGMPVQLNGVSRQGDSFTVMNSNSWQSLSLIGGSSWLRADIYGFAWELIEYA